MKLQKLIDDLMLLMAPDAEVYIEREDRSVLEPGRVVIDSDGDVIIEFEREPNARTN